MIVFQNVKNSILFILFFIKLCQRPLQKSFNLQFSFVPIVFRMKFRRNKECCGQSLFKDVYWGLSRSEKGNK